MGAGSYSVDSYFVRSAAKAAAGKTTFDYSDTLMRTTPRSAWKVHEDLDASKLNAAGLNIRESVDTDEHPNATPIAVIFDVTGSMGHIPAVLQQKLPQLHGLLQRKGYVEDPQILFGAVGDAYCDVVPLQIGQFESDNRMDEQLENIVLEGGGGGGNHESYQLAAYYLARHAELDCLKRGKKGYLFLIGDERLYANIDRRQVEKLIGDHLQEDLTTAQVFEELKAKFEVFFLFAAQGSYEPEGVVFKGAGSGYYFDDDAVCYWRDLLGQNALILEDAEAVCEFIAGVLGMMEGGIDCDEAVADLLAIGADPAAVHAAGKALATVAAGAVATATVEGDDLPDADEGGAERL